MKELRGIKILRAYAEDHFYKYNFLLAVQVSERLLKDIKDRHLLVPKIKILMVVIGRPRKSVLARDVTEARGGGDKSKLFLFSVAGLTYAVYLFRNGIICYKLKSRTGLKTSLYYKHPCLVFTRHPANRDLLNNDRQWHVRIGY